MSLKDNVLKSEERMDEIGFGDLRLIQAPKEFWYGVDAVILSDLATKISHKCAKIIIDLGTGTGVIPLIMSHKTKAESIVGVELQEPAWERAERNVRLNNLQGRLHMIHGDVKNVEVWGQTWKGSADIITCNPPYFKGNAGMRSDNSPKMIARHESTADLEDFIRCGAWLLKDKGEMFMVHRPSRLADICCFGRKWNMEPKTLCFVSPRQEEAPNILLIHFVKNGGKELRFMPPLWVYDNDGSYTAQINEAYER